MPAYELYFRALSGQAATIEVTAAAGPRAFPDTATTLRLPERPEPETTLPRRAWFRVALAHRALHQEAGTFGFRLARADARIAAALDGRGGNCDGAASGRDGESRGGTGSPEREARRDGGRPDRDDAGRGDLEVFLGSFADRRLALQLFETLEDLRIDVLLGRRYRGLAADLAAMAAAECAARPDLRAMAPRAAALEFLIRRSLGDPAPGQGPSPCPRPSRKRPLRCWPWPSRPATRVRRWRMSPQRPFTPTPCSLGCRILDALATRRRFPSVRTVAPRRPGLGDGRRKPG